MRKLCICALVVSIIHLALLPGSEATAKTYATNFPLAENPISDGGHWLNGGVIGFDWRNVRTNVGLAYGTQSGSGGYDDSTALLSGTWGPNQTCQATVYSVNQTNSFVEEVELRLRSTITAHSCTGYEVNFRCVHPGGYVQIVRWNGPLGNFSYVYGTQSPYPGIANGDVIKATINGNLIIAYVNGVEVFRGTDSTYTTGNPGIGFFNHDGSISNNDDFGFTSFTASDGIVPTPTPTPTLRTTGTATVVDFNGDGHPD